MSIENLNFDISNVDDMSVYFKTCASLDVDVSNWDTSSVGKVVPADKLSEKQAQFCIENNIEFCETDTITDKFMYVLVFAEHVVEFDNLKN